MAQHILIVGVGLIGGSIGMRARASGAEVTGSDASDAAVERALELGAIDRVAEDLGACVREADVVVVATPVGSVLGAVERVAGDVAPGAVVTDVGSTKSTIVSAAERLLESPRAFVGGHPMAGTEGEGIEAARPDLFDGAMWILTPTEHTDPDAYRRVNALVAALGARTLALDPVSHDALVARISHLPYAVATTLMAITGEEGDPRLFRAAAGAFRDITRTAGSSPAIWRDILATNAEAVAGEIDRLTDALAGLGGALRSGDLDRVDALIADARASRERLPMKGERTPAEPVVIEVPIADRAGALAQVTTIIGEGGVNIEDLWVEHASSGGVLRLVLDGAGTAEGAVEALRERGFHAVIAEQP